MAQYDLLLTQNIAATGIEYKEFFVNIKKGGILSGNTNGLLTVLDGGTNGYMLVRDDNTTTGLKWQAIPSHHTQNTDTGTTSATFHIDNDGTGPKLKNASGVLEVRNSGDSAYADVKGNNATFTKVTISGTPSAATDAATKSYVDGLLSANDAMVYKGTLGTSGTITALPTTYQAGWTYRVITAGTYAGVKCEVGDLITAVVDRSGTGNVNADWTVVQTNIDGAVTGPSTAISNDFVAIWDSNNRSLKSSGILPQDLAQNSALNNYVAKNTYTANSILYATTAETPAALTVGASTVVGRASTGNIKALSATEIRTLINVENGANKYVHFTGGGGSLSNLSGTTVISGITVNSEGHVTATETRELGWLSVHAMREWQTAPELKTSTGTKGDLAYDANYLYVCIDTDTWTRTPLATHW